MLGPLARSRAVVGAGVLLTACAGSVVLASGSGAAPVAVSTSARAYGPVAVVPAGPLDPARLRSSWPLAPVLPPVGPTVRAVVEVGPPGVVGRGSSPREVRALQRRLNARGAALRVDGAWGPATERAVRAVQAAAGLPDDGRAGPATLALLRR